MSSHLGLQRWVSLSGREMAGRDENRLRPGRPELPSTGLCHPKVFSWSRRAMKAEAGLGLLCQAWARLSAWITTGKLHGNLGQEIL